MFKQFMDINPEVEKALEEGTPVIALESTIIAHGMPYPKNVETALAVEDVIRKNGAVPATIGIIGGRIKIGLTKEERHLWYDFCVPILFAFPGRKCWGNTLQIFTVRMQNWSLSWMVPSTTRMGI